MASQTANPDEPTAAAPRGVRMGLKTWVYTINATIQRFLRNQGTDMAATLTYYMVLAIFPALLSLVSLLKLSGIGDVLVPKLTELIKQPGAEPRRRIHSTESGIAARRRERYSGAYAAERASRFAQSEAQQHDDKRRRGPGGAKVHDIKLRERCERRAAGDGDAYDITPAEPPSLFSFINERE